MNVSRVLAICCVKIEGGARVVFKGKKRFGLESKFEVKKQPSALDFFPGHPAECLE
jgi:hypothetical protein